MATTTKMTAFEFFTMIENGTITPEVIAHATAEKAKILAERERASKKRKEKSAENAPLKKSIFELVASSSGMVASQIAEALNISTSKASSMARQMVEEGLLTSEEVKSPTAKSKGKVKQYKVVATATTVDEEAVEN